MTRSGCARLEMSPYDYETTGLFMDPEGLIEVPSSLGARERSASAPAPQPSGGLSYFEPPDITRGPIERMELSITFDGGYDASDALVILDALKARGIRTTIFLTGTFIRLHPEITRRIVRDGHEVGNHTMNHPHLTDYSESRRHRTLPGVDKNFIALELKGAARAFKEVTGREMAPLWRAPYGEVNQRIRRWAFEEGYLHIGWTADYARKESLDTLDWVSDTSSRLYLAPSEIKERILSFGRGALGVRGGIVLMHLGTERKAERASGVLGEIIDSLAQSGYRFIKVSEMIKDKEELEAAARNGRRALLRGLVRLDGQAPADNVRLD